MNVPLLVFGVSVLVGCFVALVFEDKDYALFIPAALATVVLLGFLGMRALL